MQVDFKALFAIIQTPLLVLDKNMIIVAFNPAYTKATGIREADSVGKSHFEVFPENPNDLTGDGRSVVRTSFEKVVKFGVVDEIPVVKYDVPVPDSKTGEFDERFWKAVNSPIFGADGSVTHILHYPEDVTQIVQMENRNLKLQIGQQELLALKLAQESLLAAKAEAERANETKSAFLANMSHEIRTPLAAILGFSNLLRDEVLNAEEKHEYLDTIIRNGNALTKIIDDILDLAKVEAGKLEVEIVSVSLHDLSVETIELFRDKIHEKGIYLELDIAPDVPRTIQSDPTRLRQILVNLVGNAVKFTDKGGVTVRIRSSLLRENKARLVIDVQDTGIGVADDQRERLFTPFSQADNSMTRKFGGTGLGLVLSRRLSHALAGEIAISKSKAGEGSTFTFVFEAALAKDVLTREVKRVETVGGKPLPLLGLKILAVDDTPDNLLLVQRLLVKNGATVETASDGDEGALKALAGNFHVVLMDLQMPKMDGYQAKRTLDSRGYQRPVIALTAHAMSDERLKTKAAGFAAHLTKPLNAPELLATLSAYCEQPQD